MNAPVNTLYRVDELLSLDRDIVQEYWQKLYMEDRLKYRLCDIDDPQWDDVKEMILHHGSDMYCVTSYGFIVAEFMLENFTGHAAQIHFSMRPGLTATESFRAARFATDQVLKRSFSTLFGLTPATNRAARIFNQRVGFRCIGILPAGMRDRGKIVDAHIMVKESKNGR